MYRRNRNDKWQKPGNDQEFDVNPTAAKELARLHTEHGKAQCKKCGVSVPYKTWRTNNGLCSLCEE